MLKLVMLAGLMLLIVIVAAVTRLMPQAPPPRRRHRNRSISACTMTMSLSPSRDGPLLRSGGE